MFTPTRTSILIFILAVILGPLYTISGYSFYSNLISELGAQQTPNNFIMIISFIVLGCGILFDGFKHYTFSLIPFMLFGFFMGVVGLFPHKPLNPSVNFNETFHIIHGLIATLAGIVITIGFAWQGFRQKRIAKIICFYLSAVSLVFPLLMLSYKDFQGIIQRIMYFQIFFWFWIYYPNLDLKD